jgi:hypothetical protein
MDALLTRIGGMHTLEFVAYMVSLVLVFGVGLAIGGMMFYCAGYVRGRHVGDYEPSPPAELPPNTSYKGPNAKTERYSFTKRHFFAFTNTVLNWRPSARKSKA